MDRLTPLKTLLAGSVLMVTVYFQTASLAESILYNQLSNQFVSNQFEVAVVALTFCNEIVALQSEIDQTFAMLLRCFGGQEEKRPVLDCDKAGYISPAIYRGERGLTIYSDYRSRHPEKVH